MTPAREKVLAAAAEAELSPAALARAAGVSSGVVSALIADGVLAETLREAPVDFPAPDPDLAQPGLNASQAAALAELEALVGAGGFGVALLDGVTGSGKTEVYLETVAAALRRDPEAQALILLPEIALTEAVVGRIAARFGAEPAAWHSGMGPPRRRRVWEAVARGKCRIVVGARSALFLPFAKLRLIVVDEEARRPCQAGGRLHLPCALTWRWRGAKLGDAPIVLASATPSLESVWNAETGRYRWLRLVSRHGGAVLPQISLVDLKETPPETGRWPLRPAQSKPCARRW